MHTSTHAPILSSSPLYWSLIAAIVAATLALSGWTAARASTVDDVVGQVEQAEVVPPSIRQVEHAAAARVQWLQQLEHAELRRFRNRAPEWALSALDADIDRLHVELYGDQRGS